MKNKMLKVLWLAAFCAASIVSAQNVHDDETGMKIGKVLKTKLVEREKDWRLTHDSGRNLEWRNNKDESQFITIEIASFYSLEVARQTFKDMQSATPITAGEKYDGIGDEAWIFRHALGNGAIVFRTKSTVISVNASLLADAIRMAKHANDSIQ
jgi:hypothetical protein